MQKCLNDEAKECVNRPILYSILLFIGVIGIILLVVSLLCNTTYRCTYTQQDLSLYFGLFICASFILYLGFPCCVRFFLNCIFYQEPILPIRSLSPIVVVSGSKDPRRRSNSREKYPPSPRGPLPMHANMSFKEFHSQF
jgi:hypothetical protein